MTTANLLNFNTNGSYQNAINNTKYAVGTAGTPEATYLNKIPNQPWLFGNADLVLAEIIFWKSSRMQFNLVRSMFTGFILPGKLMAAKPAKTKFLISLSNRHHSPIRSKKANTMFRSNAGILTNSLAYDNFRLQKPGRAVFIKLRYFIR